MLSSPSFLFLYHVRLITVLFSSMEEHIQAILGFKDYRSYNSCSDDRSITVQTPLQNWKLLLVVEVLCAINTKAEKLNSY